MDSDRFASIVRENLKGQDVYSPAKEISRKMIEQSESVDLLRVGEIEYISFMPNAKEFGFEIDLSPDAKMMIANGNIRLANWQYQEREGDNLYVLLSLEDATGQTEPDDFELQNIADQVRNEYYVPLLCWDKDNKCGVIRGCMIKNIESRSDNAS